MVAMGCVRTVARAILYILMFCSWLGGAGVHNDSYYKLDITIFKSALDRRLLNLLWNKYWVNTLSSSAVLANAGFITGQVRGCLCERRGVGVAFKSAWSCFNVFRCCGRVCS
jgi:hypothetical protein